MNGEWRKMINKECVDCLYSVFTTDGYNEWMIGKFMTEIEAIKYKNECEKWESKGIYTHEVREL